VMDTAKASIANPNAINITVIMSLSYHLIQAVYLV